MYLYKINYLDIIESVLLIIYQIFDHNSSLVKLISRDIKKFQLRIAIIILMN